MKYTLAVAALIAGTSAISLTHHKHHHKHHKHQSLAQGTPLSNYHPWPKNNWESANIDADNSRASNDIPEHCISTGHCGITSDKQVAQVSITGPQPVNKVGAPNTFIFPANNQLAQIRGTPLSNYHPWPKNNWESANIDADNSRASNDIPEHCISTGHCGITSDKQVAQVSITGPQPVNKVGAPNTFIFPANNQLIQTQGTPLSNYHPWPKNNWESANIDADNSRASNDIPEHCISTGHCGITSDKQVAQVSITGPQPVNKVGAPNTFIFPANNQLIQTEGTPLSNYHPWPKNNWESANIDADNSRASNDIPEHCISTGHCGITSDKQVAQVSITGPQPVNKVGAPNTFIFPANNQLIQTNDPLYVPYAYKGAAGAPADLQHCPTFNERHTLQDGVTRAVSYPNPGFNCKADWGL